MEVTKRKQYTYYAVRQGAFVIIYRGFIKPTRVISVIRIPKLVSSPKYNADGTPNNGTTLRQVCYTGVFIVGALPYAVVAQKLGAYLPTGSLCKLTTVQKRTIKLLLEIK